jgi:dihydroflavonol-4-reductase
MEILITGATGFVGSHVADRLLGSGHTVRALTRHSSSLKWLEGKSITTVNGNMLDADSLQAAVTGVDAIVHVAGVTAARDRNGYFEGNQLATRALLEAVHKFNPNIKHFVQCSSLTAVGPSLDGQPVSERTPPHPITAYGASKRAAEEECETARKDFPVTILRLAAVYGPRDTAILTFFQTVNKGLKPLIGMKDKHVNLVHVADVAQYSWREVSDTTAQILKRRGLTIKLPHALVYGVAGISEFFSMFQKKPSVLNWEKGRDMVQRDWTCSVEKAKLELGYQQSISLEAGIRSTLEWYQHEAWL